MKNLLWRKRMVSVFCLLIGGGAMSAQTAVGLSFGDALRQMRRGNRSLKMAEREVEQAREERGRLNARWLPSLQSEGTFVHLSERVEVRQPLSAFTEPIKDFAQELLPEDKLIGRLLDRVGEQTLVLPLAPRNLTSVGLTAEWVLFSGGKRIRASKMGKAMVELARENRLQAEATQSTLLAESYFGLRLAGEAVRVRRETCESLQRHYENALRLHGEGMLDKAGLLFAEVNRDEARRAWEDAQKDLGVLQSALCALLGLADTCGIRPTTALFIGDRLPAREEFLQAMQTGNYALNGLRLQSEMASQQLHIEQSNYLPEIALFGKQTLYAHGIRSNLVPRTAVGVAFTWTLFDGLSRERRIRQARLTRQTLALGEEQAREELTVGIGKFFTALQKAQDNARTLETTIALGEELVRIRRQSFTEGMATSTEVVDAETFLANARLARLAACYEFDVALMNLLALCGTPEQFESYISD